MGLPEQQPQQRGTAEKLQPCSQDTGAGRPMSIGDLIEAHMDACHTKLRRLHIIKQMLPSQPTHEQSEAMLWLLSRDLK